MSSVKVANPGLSESENECACTPVANPMAEPDLKAHVVRLKALAHPVRFRMVDLIHANGGGICVCEFEHYFDVKQPTISHHLKVLRDAGLIQSRQKGSWVHHFVDPAVYVGLRDVMERFASSAPK